jgi:hypothetical protein
MGPMSKRTLALSLLLASACGGPAGVDLQPTSLRFGVRGQTASLHATPIAKNRKPLPNQICKWSSTDETVATVVGPSNGAVVTAVGPGSARIRCNVGEVIGEVDVLVRVVGRVEVEPRKIEVRMLDEPTPVALRVSVFDDAGAPVIGRTMFSRCANEDVCRGDGRAQIWGASPGDTTAVVEVESVRSGEVAVHVVDARSADFKPKAVKGNPMEMYEREYERLQAEERKKAGK